MPFGRAPVQCWRPCGTARIQNLRPSTIRICLTDRISQAASEDLKRRRVPENLAVNSKVIFIVAGGIAAAAIVIFFVLGSGSVGPPGQQQLQQQGDQPVAAGDAQPGAPKPLELSITNVTADKKDDETAGVRVTFDVYNPNRNTAILETIHYTVYVGDLRMTFGDIGISPDGFVATQEGIFPIVSNTTVTLKDTESAVRNNLTATAWDSMVNGEAQYSIKGTYSYKLTGTSFQFSTGEKEFEESFP